MVLIAAAVQLVPLPAAFVRASGSGITSFLNSYDLRSVAGGPEFRALSIAPTFSLRALLILISVTALISGLAAELFNTSCLSRRVAIAIAAIGVLVAILALAQKATFNGRIYWLWESHFKLSGNYFGPFVNRNHFAGWMLLATALTGGFLLGQIQTAGRHLKPGWRNRVLWLSGEQANAIVLTTAAMLVMLVSIMWSMSRSGISGAALALILLATVALCRLGSASRKIVAAGTVILLLCLATTWRGAGTLATWYGRTQTLEWRIQLWKDTLPALYDFWLVGSGLNTYSTVMLLYPQTDQTVHAAQAHSDYVQLALEGGLLVCIPVIVLVCLLIRVIHRRLSEPQDDMTWWIRMGAVAGICGMALQETAEFSLQIPGVAILFAVLVAVAIHEPASRAGQHGILSIANPQHGG